MWPRADISTALALLALLPVIVSCEVAQAQGAQAPVSQALVPAVTTMPTVLELFTSQGCSSCPAADALLRTYAERPRTIALSMSVDYWDHLGWKDTLATPKNTARQKAYSKGLGTGNIYTPQIVVNGAAETIGSSKTDIEKAIARTANDTTMPRPRLSASSDGRQLTIEVAGIDSQPAGNAGANAATVWLAIVAPHIEVKIKQGENRGRTLTYHNVVREMTAVGMWSGKLLKLELPANAIMEAGNRCAVIVQAQDGGRILAATWVAP